MIEHILHLPRQRRYMEVRPAQRPGECPYCHVGTIRNLKCDRCGVLLPSPSSETSPEKFRKLSALRKKAQATEYRPQFDGLCDPDPHSLTAAVPWG